MTTTETLGMTGGAQESGTIAPLLPESKTARYESQDPLVIGSISNGMDLLALESEIKSW